MREKCNRFTCSAMIDAQDENQRGIRRNISRASQTHKVLQWPMSPEEAKKKVFDYWDQLGALSKRRFPKNENLSEEALLYLINRLEADEWKRIRAWQGLGPFVTYLLTLTSRLFTDFSREKFGYIRKPTWLKEQKDPLWDKAYRLLTVDKYERRVAIELLRSSEPNRADWYIEEVVTTITAKCVKQPMFSEQMISLDDQKEQAAVEIGPDEALDTNSKDMIEALQFYIQKNGDPPVTSQVGEILRRLNPHIALTGEDRLLLRLRYSDGMKMKHIVKLMGLRGNPYRRYDKIIGHIRRACQRAGLLNI